MTKHYSKTGTVGMLRKSIFFCVLLEKIKPDVRTGRESNKKRDYNFTVPNELYFDGRHSNLFRPGEGRGYDFLLGGSILARGLML